MLYTGDPRCGDPVNLGRDVTEDFLYSYQAILLADHARSCSATRDARKQRNFVCHQEAAAVFHTAGHSRALREDARPLVG